MFDLNTFNELAIASLPLAAFITAIVAAIKTSFKIENARPIPAVATVVGAAIGFLLVQANGLGILVGIALGLSSTGLYEVGKTTIAGKRG